MHPIRKKRFDDCAVPCWQGLAVAEVDYLRPAPEYQLFYDPTRALPGEASADVRIRRWW